MNKISFISIIFILLYSYTINAQTADSLQTNKFGISVGYWGTPINNRAVKGTIGFKLGLERYNLQTNKYKILTSADLIVENRPESYTSFGLLFSAGVRRTLRSGLYFEYAIKAGYVGNYYPFDVYKVNSKGEIANIGNKVFHTFVYGNSLGLGYDFSCKTNLNLQFFIKPILYYRIPNNDNPFYLTKLAFETGVSFQPKFLNR